MEIFETIYKDYKRAETLYHADNDEATPFKTKYEAKEILIDLISKIDDTNEATDEVVIAKATLHYFVAKIEYESEDRPSAVARYKICLGIIEPFKFDTRATSCFMKACNDIAVVWSEREESQNAFKYLMMAKKVHNESLEKNQRNIWDQWEVLKPDNERLSKTVRIDNFEDTYTHTLFFLAQTTKHLGDSDQSAEYCGMCLERQLNSGNFNAREWSLHSACLSQYYLSIDDYCTAHHCLRAGSIMLTQEMVNCSESDETVKNKMIEAEADLARCWIKYCVAFLEHSSKKLIFRQIEAELERLDDMRVQCPKVQFKIDDSGSDVGNFDGIPIKPIETLQDANRLHLRIKIFYDTAISYFKLDGWVTDNVEVTQDMSRAWKFLSEFDTNLERRCKMHKRRVDLILPLLLEINAQFYLQICRQMQFEVGEIYSEMTDLKISLADKDEQPSLHQMKKINVLANSGLKFFINFMDTMREPDKKWPEKFDPLLARPFLMANFHSARLYGKLISIKREERLKWTQESWHHYKLIIETCERDPNAKHEIVDELPLVVEMNTLMPQKLSQIAQSPSLR